MTSSTSHTPSRPHTSCPRLFLTLSLLALILSSTISSLLSSSTFLLNLKITDPSDLLGPANVTVANLEARVGFTQFCPAAPGAPCVSLADACDGERALREQTRLCGPEVKGAWAVNIVACALFGATLLVILGQVCASVAWRRWDADAVVVAGDKLARWADAARWVSLASAGVGSACMAAVVGIVFWVGARSAAVGLAENMGVTVTYAGWVGVVALVAGISFVAWWSGGERKTFAIRQEGGEGLKVLDV